ncbi:hypothetical protein [Paenarthrobacter aurescens]|nr:hypothetical protein [Paenarthrobacter aurescens]MDO6144581.1 hypothetical protein [Paenarthrobacter aurescens]MDO6148426.1 hypothetical protein [Paenarthrobacter aurescens]MDO6159672.1 hypothetical protein [Paenarthrobacter aurescens]MDO6164574.1 hypothetical protein [Paenarthrobacter aurescens]
MFVTLVAAASTLIVASVAWVTLLIMQGEAPNPLVVAPLSLVGLLGGAFMGSRFWDDRQTLRQRMTEDHDGVLPASGD